MGAFLSAAAGCVAVGPALDPEAPVVEISAPQVVGCCNDLIMEGIASYPSTGMQHIFTYTRTERLLSSCILCCQGKTASLCALHAPEGPGPKPVTIKLYYTVLEET